MESQSKKQKIDTESTCQITVNPFLKLTPPSPTQAINAVANKMRAAGSKLYDFGVGETFPELLVPDLFKNELKKALDNNETHYVSEWGDMELRQALSDDFPNFGLNYGVDQIVVCAGPKDALYKCVLTLLNPLEHRNRAIVFSPIYESFVAHPAFIAGKQPFVVKGNEDFLPNMNEFERILKQHHSEIKIVIVNSPQNPTGVVYPSSMLQQMATMLAPYPEIAIVSDEVYRTMYHGESKYDSMARYLPNRTFICGGLSKEVAGTGLRLGWVAGPVELMKWVALSHGSASSCCCLSTQKAYARFLKQDKDMKIRRGLQAIVSNRRDLFLKTWKELPTLRDRVPLHIPEGGFYVFPCLENFLGKKRPDTQAVIKTDEDLSLYLLEKSYVVTIAGTKFDKPGHLRLVYLRSPEVITTGLKALNDALSQLQ